MAQSTGFWLLLIQKKTGSSNEFPCCDFAHVEMIQVIAAAVVFSFFAIWSSPFVWVSWAVAIVGMTFPIPVVVLVTGNDRSLPVCCCLKKWRRSWRRNYVWRVRPDLTTYQISSRSYIHRWQLSKAQVSLSKCAPWISRLEIDFNFPSFNDCICKNLLDCW